MLHGLPRRSTAIAAGVLLLSGALSSCGFDYATNRVNTISSGVNDRDGEVDILGAAIISGAPDTGLFVATLANANPNVPISLTGVAGGVAPADDLTPVEVDPQGIVSLYQTGGISLTGPIGLGDFVSVELTFSSGQTSTLDVAVMRPCFEYDPTKFPGMVLPSSADAAGSETPAEGTEGTESTEAETPAEGAETAEGEGEESTSATDPYSCNPIEQEPHGEGEE